MVGEPGRGRYIHGLGDDFSWSSVSKILANPSQYSKTEDTEDIEELLKILPQRE